MKTKSYKNGSNDFIVLGTNANGILSKMESLRLLFDKFKPAVVFLQETKVTRKGQVKIPEYEIFEVVRPNSKGGSILTALHSNLNPVFISGGENEQEMGNLDCRFINAYGPQE